MTSRKADAVLIFACLLWGVSFVVVKGALQDITPCAFAAIRFGIAALALAPFARLGRPWSRTELLGGALLGLQLGGGFLAQTAGLVWTTPSRSAFIVAISSVLAPVFAAVVLRERPRWPLVVALALATLGLYWLTDPGGVTGGLNRGDALTLITALLFGGQIVAIAALSRRFDAVRLVWMQVVVTAAMGGLGALVLERPRVHWTPAVAAAIAFTAVGATAVALWLQIVAQRYMSSARAALLFCFETLFAATTSWLVLGERLSGLQWLGGGLILGGMVLAEVKPQPAPVEVPGPHDDISAPQP